MISVFLGDRNIFIVFIMGTWTLVEVLETVLYGLLGILTSTFVAFGIKKVRNYLKRRRSSISNVNLKDRVTTISDYI